MPVNYSTHCINAYCHLPTQVLYIKSKFMTQNYRIMKMFNQTNALSDMPQALSLFLDILTCCFDLLNKYILKRTEIYSLVLTTLRKKCYIQYV